MSLLRRILFTRVMDPFRSAVLSPLLTGIGVFTFLAGVFYLPTLAPSKVEMIMALLLLGILALLCTAVGQLAVVIEKLEHRRDGAN